jgi:hypothetical protein
MSDPRRLSGLAGATLAAMAIAAFVLDFAIIATTGGPPQIYLDSLSADLVRARASAIWPIETWLYALQLVPFAIFVPGLRATLRAAGEATLADVTVLALMLFMALHTLHNLIILTVVQVIVPSYVPGGADAAATEAVARGLLGLAYAAFLPGGGVGGALLIAGLIGFASVQGRARSFPAWSGRLAAAGALLMTVAYAQYVVAPTFFLALLGYVAYLAWIVVVSVSLLRPAPRGSSVLTPASA